MSTETVRKVTRAEKVLNTWAQNPNIELSNSGKNWLIAALDPFHDTPLKLEGWPDVSVAPSVCRTVKQTVNVSATAGTVLPWDLHIANFPTTDAFGMFVCANRANNVATAVFGTPATTPLGGIVGIQTAAGVPVSWQVPTGDPSVRLNVQVPTAYTQGSSRIISQAFEVRDTTAAIYRQGSCTAWRQAQSRDTSGYHILDATVASGVSHADFTGTALRLPPSSSAEAMLYPGSFTHKAEQGLYSISTFNNEENAPLSASYNQPVYHHADKDDRSGASTTNGDLFYVPNFVGSMGHVYNVGAVPVTERQYFSPPCKILPINTNGCILAGLNPNSTFEITSISVIETFPSISEDILTLATPSSQFDGLALKIYSHAMMVMPVAVPVGENATGDWFFEVIQKLGKFLAPVLEAIPHPIARSAGAVARAAGDSAGNMLGNRIVVTGPPLRPKLVGHYNQKLYKGKRGKRSMVSGPMEKMFVKPKSKKKNR